jgi:hypothetical protein
MEKIDLKTLKTILIKGKQAKSAAKLSDKPEVIVS